MSRGEQQAKREVCRRLFVPLSRDPYSWFSSGQKQWEIRRQRGAFSEGQITVGRRVELRLGYRDASSSLWGEIAEHVHADSLVDVFKRVPYQRAIPVAQEMNSALAMASQILRLAPDQKTGISAFRVHLDEPSRAETTIRISRAYKEKILQGLKVTTIRRTAKSFQPGRATLRFSTNDELPVVITAVTRLPTHALTTADAHRDGFSSRGELLDALRHHYPDLQNDSWLSILEFKWTT